MGAVLEVGMRFTGAIPITSVMGISKENKGMLLQKIILRCITFDYVEHLFQ